MKKGMLLKNVAALSLTGKMSRLRVLAPLSFIIVALLGVCIGVQGIAHAQPTSFGNPYPYYPQFSGIVGAMTGRVTVAGNSSEGIAGAYVSIVNANNPSVEYFNTTSDSYGNYQIVGLNATYSSVLKTGENDTTPYGEGYTAGQNAYMIYAYNSTYGSGYSQAFGIDANNTGMGPGMTTTPLATSVVLPAHAQPGFSNGWTAALVVAIVVAIGAGYLYTRI